MARPFSVRRIEKRLDDLKNGWPKHEGPGVRCIEIVRKLNRGLMPLDRAEIIANAPDDLRVLLDYIGKLEIDIRRLKGGR